MNIIGRITRDAEVRTIPGEKKVVSFSVAINDSYKNKQGERVQLTEYVDCAWFRSTGVAKVLTKGSLVGLTGRISAKAWLDREGKPKAGLRFTASNIELYGGSKTAQVRDANGAGIVPAGKKPAAVAAADAADDDLPF